MWGFVCAWRQTFVWVFLLEALCDATVYTTQSYVFLSRPSSCACHPPRAKTLFSILNFVGEKQTIDYFRPVLRTTRNTCAFFHADLDLDLKLFVAGENGQMKESKRRFSTELKLSEIDS